MEDWTVLVGLSAFLTFCVSMIDHLFKVVGFVSEGQAIDASFLGSIDRCIHRLDHAVAHFSLHLTVHMHLHCICSTHLKNHCPLCLLPELEKNFSNLLWTIFVTGIIRLFALSWGIYRWSKTRMLPSELLRSKRSQKQSLQSACKMHSTSERSKLQVRGTFCKLSTFSLKLDSLI